MKLIMFASLALILIFILLKEAISDTDGHFILNRDFHRFNIMFGVSLMVLVDVFGASCSSILCARSNPNASGQDAATGTVQSREQQHEVSS
jgi:hypothetical protein